MIKIRPLLTLAATFTALGGGSTLSQSPPTGDAVKGNPMLRLSRPLWRRWPFRISSAPAGWPRFARGGFASFSAGGPERHAELCADGPNE
jgi:hypothetical protein